MMGPFLWQCAASDLPEPGTRIVILYDDGSGATLGMWTGDTVIDSDGGERALFEDAGIMWAPLPAGFRLWCEVRGDDPYDFSSIDKFANEEGAGRANNPVGDIQG